MEEYCLDWLAAKAGMVELGCVIIESNTGCTSGYIVKEMELVLKGIHFLLGKEVTKPGIDDIFKGVRMNDLCRLMYEPFVDAMSNYYGGKCPYHANLEMNITPHCALGYCPLLTKCIICRI